MPTSSAAMQMKDKQKSLRADPFSAKSIMNNVKVP